MLFLLCLALTWVNILASVTTDQRYLGDLVIEGFNEMSKDVAYGPGLDQKLDVYLPPAGVEAGLATIVLVHGGAWRSGDKSNYEGLASRILQTSNCPVIAVNYRLSPRSEGPTVHHPAHVLDLLEALSFIRQHGSAQLGVPQSSLDNLYLLGHSCGAHMITSLVLEDPSGSNNIVTPPELLANIKGLFLSEGIYDIDLLLKKFPSYSDFIQGAFGKRESYKEVSPAHYQLRGDTPIYWLVVHSKGDQLVNEEQAESLWDHLWELYDRRAHQYVEADWERLNGNHDEILENQEYADMVAQFVNETLAKGTAAFL
ncbi:alpha/beta hydrolase family protein [Ceratobasidium sp. AG-Ba]|nr:alpha/beta hydrolase family protein [Ceratobasidium sp. AG-Ba]